MQIYQPMLYVGLGGTGCRVGAELERRLREELCGPDGTELQHRMQGKNFLPYQLPSCLQFVYADLSEDEFGALERRVVPDPEYLPAAERTMHLVRELVPHHDTYPEVARSLRLAASQYVDPWLPPPTGEPRIGPLARGAGQLPTVGRAALFETFRGGTSAAQAPLRKAIGAINNSLGELALLGGGHRALSCDVFVAFSVAGGTGSGIFFDFLHLIGDVFAHQDYRARIFPLVLMPSAFDEGLGGGRAARLNAGRSLLDLFRLVDDQNAQVAGTELDSSGISGSLSVRYPDREEIRLRASTVQTAFLFGKGAGVQREDLHRSIVSLVLSLIGTDLGTDGDGGTHAIAQTYMSFADSFINSAVEREVPAPTGIGNRGVSTSSVASMTVPVDDIAEIISSRLLAAAVTELDRPATGQAENNSPFIERFFTESNVDPLRLRAPVPIKEVAAVSGAEAISRALATRARTMESGLRTLDQQLARQIPDMVQTFDAGRAVKSLLGEIDLFRLRRVLNGHDGLTDEPSALGFAKILELRRGEPAAPPGLTLNPPTSAGIKGKFLRKLQFSDPAVQAAIKRQNEWYEWRAKRVWHAAWNDQAVRWDLKLKAVQQQVLSLVTAFEEHARQSERRFSARARELYQQRVGVTYLLPRQGDLEPFYDAVVRRFVDYYVHQGGTLHPTATAGDLVTEILGEEGWQHAYDMVLDGRGPAMAVAHVKDQVKQAVKRLFSFRDGQHRPLLPALQELLAAAAGKPGARVGDDELAQFREKLAGLVPGGFAPSGTGKLRILFSYPAAAKDLELEKFLRGEVSLPRQDAVVEFRPIAAESITVVLFRSSMGLTEVPEVREVLKHWSDALKNEEQQDFLKWRQRLGYDFGYLATIPEHRERILHHLLCAAWNDQITVTGAEDSPSAITVKLGDGAQASMRLPLEPFGRMSSWASLLSAYEAWVLTDDEQIRRDFCAKLISTTPRGVDRRPDKPAQLFDQIVGMASAELARIDTELGQRTGESGTRRLLALREFWEETLPGALRLPFRGVTNPLQDNLDDLREWVARDPEWLRP
ncbi:tubulin-like doman-containing protein [Lentzea terrae]|uniref:tubulin-like doman-containing protein n=1 Tax=Lentzea terrae TaxID=2200761 RepID=UPI000DD44F41|nr:tubulin-like doman-containing protein [Lentzea terrae]